MFLKLIFKYNTLDFSRAYFDLTDWADNPKDISYYLSNGTFGDLMDSIDENASKMSLSDIAKLEKDCKNILIYGMKGKSIFLLLVLVVLFLCYKMQE